MHAFANDGDEEARLRVEVRPALRMEEMFAEVVAMAQAGRMTRRGLPRNLLDLATLARRYDQEAHAPFLRVGVQRMLLAPLVASARHPRGAPRGRRRGRDREPRPARLRRSDDRDVTARLDVLTLATALGCGAERAASSSPSRRS